MVYLFILLAIVYFFIMRHYVQRWNLQSEQQNSDKLKEMNEMYFRLAEQRDVLLRSKVGVEDEAFKVFTLYDMTKEITKTLNENDAFEIFRQNLLEHAEFSGCEYLAEDFVGMSQYKDADRYFVFELKSERKNIGTVVIENLNPDDQDKVTILCHQFALALRRVKLYQEIERTAITDSLTNVYTRRYTLQRFEEEFHRSRTRDINMALLMIDVDHFKKCNDTYGHLVGDEVLRVVGKIIKDSIREIDIPGRFGGEEFCVVLPDTDTKGAKYVAERVREAIEGEVIQAFDAKVSVTVSIGIAVFPRDAKESNELIDKADWTLYKAKKQGRNRVCIFCE